MQIIKAGYQLIDEPNITKKIERIARICYKSEDKIGEGTDLKMVNDLIARQHTAMLEHADVCLVVAHSDYYFIRKVMETMSTQCHDDSEPKNCYLRTTYHSSNEPFDGLVTYGQRYVVSGNIRAWHDYFEFAVSYGYGIQEKVFEAVNGAANNIFDKFADGVGVSDGVSHFFKDTPSDVRLVTDYSKLSDAERMVHETMSILFTVDRGVTHELVRHRDCSFAQESTRYCNYSLDHKYGREITVIEPLFFAQANKLDNPTEVWSERYGAWREGCEQGEKAYFRITDTKAPAQQARDVLPTSVKAEIVMTANLREWKHIFNLRACDATGPAHPQMKEVMIPAFKEARTKYPFAYGNMYAADEVHE